MAHKRAILCMNYLTDQSVFPINFPLGARIPLILLSWIKRWTQIFEVLLFRRNVSTLFWPIRNCSISLNFDLCQAVLVPSRQCAWLRMLYSIHILSGSSRIVMDYEKQNGTLPSSPRCTVTERIITRARQRVEPHKVEKERNSFVARILNI